jgi:eukaryotic-like serine/threonine-protein kinase
MLQPKQRIGEYLLEELIGRGPFAEVWRARHHMWSDQIVAVKIPADPAYIDNLRRDGVRVQRLVHPNIVHPIGFDPMADPPYLISQYIAGGSLRPWASKKRLTVSRAVNALRQVLTALQYAHEQGIIHGDIKPENVLLEPTAIGTDFAEPGTVKIGDFGIGLAALATALGARGGTGGNAMLSYIAPELRQGTSPDAKSDIYAVGIVLFEMLTGERPTGAELPSEMNADVPAELDEVFRNSYARRERRFETAQQFLDALPADPNADQGILRLADEPPAPPKSLPAKSPPQSPPARPAAPPSPPPDLAAVEEQERLAPPPKQPGDSTTIMMGAPTRPRPPDASQVGPISEIPRTPSRAPAGGAYDEMADRPIRSADELRLAFRSFFQGRALDEGESANIHLRLVRWATTQTGGQSELAQTIELRRALSRPIYIAKLVTQTMEETEDIRTAALDHPAADLALLHLKADDYRLAAHISTGWFDEKFLEAAPVGPLRIGVVGLVQEVRREFWGRIQRQDILLFTSNAIVAEYEFDNHPYRAFLIGNGLDVVADSEPFTKIRQEPTKRAAAMLEGEQIHQGIRELRRGLEQAQWQAKSSAILSALRGKLAAAYMVEAKNVFKNFGWLESLELSAKAGQLAPSSDEPLHHAAKVRKWVMRMQFLPGLLIALVFVGLGVYWGMDITPHNFKTIAINTLGQPFFVAGFAAIIASFIAARSLGTRMSRTDLAFFHAMLLPTIIAIIIAIIGTSPALFADRIFDLVCGLALVAVIVLDVLLFKYLRHMLIRPPPQINLVGDELTVLTRIEEMLAADWEMLHDPYLSLGPLYSFTSVQAVRWQTAAMMDRDEEGGFEGEPGDPALPPPRAAALPRLQRLEQEITQALSAALRALAAPTRMLATTVAEYNKAADTRQTAPMQSNAAKIEQRGKELAALLMDLDRLCASPPGLGPRDAQELSHLVQQLAARCDAEDIQMLRSAADAASGFRQDPLTATQQLTPILPQLQRIAERFRHG